jgi:hypothetical protein
MFARHASAKPARAVRAGRAIAVMCAIGVFVWGVLQIGTPESSAPAAPVPPATRPPVSASGAASTAAPTTPAKGATATTRTSPTLAPHETPPPHLEPTATPGAPEIVDFATPPATRQLAAFPVIPAAHDRQTDDAHVLRYVADMPTETVVDWYRAQLASEGYRVQVPTLPDFVPVRALNFVTPDGLTGSVMVQAGTTARAPSTVLVVFK